MQIHRKGKQISVCQRLGSRGLENDMYRVSFQGNKNVLKLDSDNGCTIL